MYPGLKILSFCSQANMNSKPRSDKSLNFIRFFTFICVIRSSSNGGLMYGSSGIMKARSSTALLSVGTQCTETVNIRS